MDQTQSSLVRFIITGLALMLLMIFRPQGIFGDRREIAIDGRPELTAAQAALADVATDPGAKKPDPIIVGSKITRTFGGLTAVDVEHIEIQRGVITALIGPNGAGKTTLFNLLTGFDEPDTGTWRFNGNSLQRVSAFRVARLGMVRTFQLDQGARQADRHREHAPGRHGAEGREPGWRRSSRLWSGQEREITARADELLARFKLDAKREDFAGSLSGGQRKLLEMARALMVDPELMMLDEPMAGVNPALKQSLLGHVQSLRDEGTHRALRRARHGRGPDTSPTG